MDVYVAAISVTTAEVRIRNSSRKPRVLIEPSTNNPTIEIRRASSAGQWICSLGDLAPGSTYHVTVNETRKLRIQTLDTKGLGEKYLRIGILTDTHVNFRSHNGKRLYGSARHLMNKYATKLVKRHGVDCIVLPGDVCDTGSDKELCYVASVLSNLSVPSFPVIGNHEQDLRRFTQALTPGHPQGYYSEDLAGGKVHLVLLATDTQDSLNEGTKQLAWLRQDLNDSSQKAEIILVFLHYSLILHPLHNDGQWDDGLQLLDNAVGVLKLLGQYSAVKAILAGHKNVPSKLMDQFGLLHTLSPQLIQVPCGYDVVDVYEHGLIRTVYEIDEMDLQDVSRRAAGEQETLQRCGKVEDRSFRYDWPTRSRKT